MDFERRKIDIPVTWRHYEESRVPQGIPEKNFLALSSAFVLFSQPIAMGDVGEDFGPKSRYDDGRDALWIEGSPTKRLSHLICFPFL